MSADLLVSRLDRNLFSVDGCVRFVSQFGIGLSFPDGLDLESQSGYLPCAASGLGEGGTEANSPVDAGFELTRLGGGTPGETELVLTVAAGDTVVDWALAHAFAAYCVAECGGQLEDPQEDTTYTRDNLDSLRSLVDALVAEARES